MQKELWYPVKLCVFAQQLLITTLAAFWAHFKNATSSLGISVVPIRPDKMGL